MFEMYGIPISNGIQFGTILVKSDPSKDICYTYIKPQNIDSEVKKYLDALAELVHELDALKLSTTSNIISKQMIELY
ncbi:MAG: phosphoenolpyruvate-utilizing N-terminal domain-containing protein, partial [Brevinema sp.]